MAKHQREMKSRSVPSVTENEGLCLALLARSGPLTAHQVAKAYELSPVSNISSSKGKIYPIIKRLLAQGLISAKKVKDDRRGTEHLTCTTAGLKAVRSWVRALHPAQILPEDGLRSRVQSFGLLTAAEQAKWVDDAHRLLVEKLDELDRYSELTETPFQELVHQNAVMTIQARMSWLDRIYRELALERSRVISIRKAQ